MGIYAVELLLQGYGGRCVGMVKGELVHHDIIDAIENKKKPFNEALFEVSQRLF